MSKVIIYKIIQNVCDWEYQKEIELLAFKDLEKAKEKYKEILKDLEETKNKNNELELSEKYKNWACDKPDNISIHLWTFEYDLETGSIISKED